MVRQIELTPSNIQKIDELSRQTGQTPDEVVNDAVRRLPMIPSGKDQGESQEWKTALLKIKGMWKDRGDLPDVRQLRESWDRSERLK